MSAVRPVSEYEVLPVTVTDEKGLLAGRVGRHNTSTRPNNLPVQPNRAVEPVMTLACSCVGVLQGNVNCRIGVNAELLPSEQLLRIRHSYRTPAMRPGG